jgi:hypothetical protein
MAANPGKETIGAHANCANALNKSIIPLLELLLVLLLLFPVILLCVSKEVFCGDFCAHFPLSQDWSLSVILRGARVATIQRATEGNVPVVYVVLASDPRAKDLSAFRARE